MKITFLVCTKRISTRCFQTDAQFCDRSGNPVAGTVVDEFVVDRRWPSFVFFGHQVRMLW